MPYNFAADSFHTKKTSQQTFFKRTAILDENRPFCVFEPPFESLGTTYDVHLGLVGKRVVDFLLVLIGTFSLGVTAESLRANIGSKLAISLQRGPVDPKFQVEWVAPTNYSSSQKTRLNDLTYGIKIWIIFLPFCHNPRVRQRGGQTDGQTDSFLIARPRLHFMQRGKNFSE